jgi:hypothetical protein
MKCCEDCHHSEPAVMEDAPVLECRRFPPSLFVIDADDANPVSQSWPHMRSDDWCGEFMPKRG